MLEKNSKNGDSAHTPEQEAAFTSANENSTVESSNTNGTHTESIAAVKVTPVVTPFDDFDWTVDKRNVVRYNEDDRKKYDEEYSSTLKTIENDEIVKGTVVAITSADVVLNIGFKSDGLVPLTE